MYSDYKNFDTMLIVFQVIGFIAAVLGRTGTKTDVMKQVPKFIRQVNI